MRHRLTSKIDSNIKGKRAPQADIVPSNHFGETDYSAFTTARHMVEPSKLVNSDRHFYKDDNGAVTAIPRSNRTSRKLRLTPDDADKVFDYIAEKLGFRRISTKMRNGFYAIVFEGPEHQMVRVDSSDEYRPKVALVIQPLRRAALKEGYTIEVLPKVDTLEAVLENPRLMRHYNIPADNVKEWVNSSLWKLKRNLEKCGLYGHDLDNFLNLAVTKDKKGKPILTVLDAGAAHVADPQLYEHAKRGNRLVNHYEAAQTSHLNSIGLKAGKLKGVLNTKQLEKALHDFLAERESLASAGYIPEKSLYYSALKQGVSPGEFSAAVRRTLKMETGEGEGFCKMIKAQLTKHGVRSL